MDCNQIRVNLVQKGYISYENSQEFLGILQKELDEYSKNISDKIDNGDIKIDDPDLTKAGYIKQVLNEVVDYDIIDYSLKMANLERQKYRRNFLSEKASKEITNKFVNTTEALKQYKPINDIDDKAFYRRSMEKVFDNITIDIQKNQGMLANAYYEKVKMLNVNVNDKKMIMDIKQWTTDSDNRAKFKEFIVNKEFKNGSGDDLKVFENVKLAEEQLDKGLKSVYGQEASFENVLNHQILKDGIAKLKEDFLKKKRSNLKNAEKVLLQKDIGAGIHLEAWRKYLYDYIEKNLIDQSKITGTKANEIKIDKIVNDMIYRLDQEFTPTKAISKEVELRDFTTITGGIFNFNRYSMNLRQDFLQEITKLDFDVMDSYKTAIGTSTRKYGVVKTLGITPEKTMIDGIEGAKRIFGTENANFTNAILELFDDYKNLINLETGKVKHSNKTLGMKGADFVINLGYGRGLPLTVFAQIGDMGKMVMNLGALSNRKHVGLKGGAKVAKTFIDVMTKQFKAKLKGEQIKLDSGELAYLWTAGHKYAELALEKINSVDFITSKSDTVLGSLENSFDTQGLSGVYKEAGSKLSLMHHVVDTFNKMGYEISQWELELTTRFDEQTSLRQNIITASGFNKETYNKLMEVAERMGYVNRLDFKKFIANVSKEDLTELYEHALMNDTGMILQKAEFMASFMNQFLRKEHTPRGYTQITEEGAKRLFKNIKEYYDEKGFKSWVDILSDNQLEVIRANTNFRTLNGLTMRVELDKEAIYKAFRNEKTYKELLVKLGLNPEDMDVPLDYLFDTIQRDLNFRYQESLKEDIMSFQERAMKDVKIREKVKNFTLEKFKDEKNLKEFDKELEAFKSELNFRFENYKLHLADKISAQNATSMELSQVISRENYTMLKFATFMKNSLMRSTRNVIDVLHYSAIDLKNGGKESYADALIKGIEITGVLTIFGMVGLLIQDAIDLDIETFDKLEDETAKEVSKIALNSLSESLFVGHGLNPSKLAMDLQREKQRAVSIGGDIIEGDLEGAGEKAKKGMKNIFVNKRVYDVYEAKENIINLYSLSILEE